MGLKHPSPQHPDSAPASTGSRHFLPGPDCILLVGYLIALSLGVPRATPVSLSHSYAGQCPAAPALAAFCDLCVSLSRALGKPLLPRVPPRSGMGTRF